MKLSKEAAQQPDPRGPTVRKVFDFYIQFGHHPTVCVKLINAENCIGCLQTGEGNGVAMNNHEDDEIYDDLEGNQPKRSKRTKFRNFDDKDRTSAKRDKHSSKRSHRQKSIKDDSWPDADD